MKRRRSDVPLGEEVPAARDFNQIKIILPLVCMLAAITTVYLTSERRIDLVNQTADEIRTRQERLRELSVLTGDVVTAESAERGYLLTRNKDYLKPFNSAKDGARTMLTALENGTANDAQAASRLNELGKVMETMFAGMDHVLQLASSSSGAALQILRTDAGLNDMQHIERLEAALTVGERGQLVKGLSRFADLNRTTQIVVALEFGVVIALLLVAAKLLWRDLDRRSNQAEVLEEMVRQRTAEIRALTDHMHRATEEVRYNLARELHDELGGILIGMKIDLSQVEKKLDIRSQPQLARRWDNIQTGLMQAIELKRRVIEELHPSLLDTMGLAAAIRWLAGQFCERLGLRLKIDAAEPSPPLPPHDAIQLFRIVQECLTNIGKHARASQVHVRLASSPSEVVLEVADNGVGMSPGSENRAQSHGVRGMRSRIEGLGGSLACLPNHPGTRIVVRMPRHTPEQPSPRQAIR